MKLILVEWDDVPRYWPHIEHWMELGLEVSLAYRPPDILFSLLLGQRQLWIAEDETGEVFAFTVTEILNTPRAKILWSLVTGGKKIDAWVHFEGAISEWARKLGCKAFEGPGRKGWERKMEKFGFVPVFQIFRKML